jgi:uncharacterized protein YjiS (DUF1127 family)
MFEVPPRFRLETHFAAYPKKDRRETRPEWYIFPFGKPQHTDPTRPVTTFKTARRQAKAAPGVNRRWHDNRHTFVTDLAEASDETIQDLAGHVSKRMLSHYSHIRMEAKRRAVDALVRKGADDPIAISADAGPCQKRHSRISTDEKRIGVTKKSTQVALLN